MDRNKPIEPIGVIDKSIFKDPDNKVCLSCKKAINEKTDRWVNVRDYDCEGMKSQVFFHQICWKNRYSIASNQMNTQFQSIMKQSLDILKNPEKLENMQPAVHFS